MLWFVVFGILLCLLELCYIYGLFKFMFSLIFCGEWYFNRDWFLFMFGFVVYLSVWECFGLFCFWGEYWFMCMIFVLFDIVLCLLFCENCFICIIFEICVGCLYYLFVIRENSGFLRYVIIVILFVFGVYLFCG